MKYDLNSDPEQRIMLGLYLHIYIYRSFLSHEKYEYGVIFMIASVSV